MIRPDIKEILEEDGLVFIRIRQPFMFMGPDGIEFGVHTLKIRTALCMMSFKHDHQPIPEELYE